MFKFVNRYVEEHVQKTGVAIETQGFSLVTSGKKRESLTVNWHYSIFSTNWWTKSCYWFCIQPIFAGTRTRSMEVNFHIWKGFRKFLGQTKDFSYHWSLFNLQYQLFCQHFYSLRRRSCINRLSTDGPLFAHVHTGHPSSGLFGLQSSIFVCHAWTLVSCGSVSQC